MDTTLKQQLREPFLSVENKRMDELTQSQQADALELWLIDQLDYIKQSNEQMGGWIEFLLTRSFEQRAAADMHGDHKRQLMESITETGIAAGVMDKNGPTDGPSLLVALDEIKHAFNDDYQETYKSHEFTPFDDDPEPFSGPSM